MNSEKLEVYLTPSMERIEISNEQPYEETLMTLTS